MKELFDAIRSGQTSEVKRLITADAQLVNALDDKGLAPLTVALYHRQPEIAALLEQHGAAKDACSAAMSGDLAALGRELAASPEQTSAHSADGWTPLHLAGFFGHADCVRLLIAAGAKINERSTSPMTNMPLHAAAAGRNLDVVRILLEHGAWVNARQHGGWTALHAAAQNGDVALAQLLIAAGADVAARADNQQSPLDLALTKGHSQMVDTLEHYGAAGA